MTQALCDLLVQLVRLSKKNGGKVNYVNFSSTYKSQLCI